MHLVVQCKPLKNQWLPLLRVLKYQLSFDVLTSLSSICDQIIVGGGIANTFLAAAGYNVGKSLCEPDLIDTAKAIAAKVSVPLTN